MCTLTEGLAGKAGGGGGGVFLRTEAAWVIALSGMLVKFRLLATSFGAEKSSSISAASCDVVGGISGTEAFIAADAPSADTLPKELDDRSSRRRHLLLLLLRLLLLRLLRRRLLY